VGKWKTYTVQELVDLGVIERPMDGNHGAIHPKAADYVSSGIPFVAASDLRAGRVDLNNCAFISEQQARTLAKGFSKAGDVLLSHKATIGRSAIVQDSPFPFIMLTPQVTYYRIKDCTRLNNRFLKYYFESKSFLDVFQAWAGGGSTRAYLGITAQLALPIPLPPLDIQQSIADLVGPIDDKIELNRRMNETLEQMAQTIFKDWFVDFGPVRRKQEGASDFIAILGGLVLDAARAGELATLFPETICDNGLPKGWQNEALLGHAKLISGGTPKTDVEEYWNGDIRWASAKDVSQCRETFLVDTERSITERGLNESSTRLIPALATVIVARGATTGRFCLFASDMAMNQTCYALFSDRRPFWLYCAFANVVEGLVHAAHGSVFDTITTKTFAQANVVNPGARLFDEFEELAGALYHRARASTLESRTLAETRDYLLPKLMSGEVRVRDAERELVA
jgi:type I restriction enzyme S subunit